MRVRGVQCADEEADETPEGGANCHGGDEDPRGDFGAVGYDDEEGADYCCEEEGEDVSPAVGGSIQIRLWKYHKKRGRGNGNGWATICKEERS